MLFLIFLTSPLGSSIFNGDYKWKDRLNTIVTEMVNGI